MHVGSDSEAGKMSNFYKMRTSILHLFKMPLTIVNFIVIACVLLLYATLTSTHQLACLVGLLAVHPGTCSQHDSSCRRTSSVSVASQHDQHSCEMLPCDGEKTCTTPGPWSAFPPWGQKLHLKGYVICSFLSFQKNMPKFNKIPFYLQPHSSSGAKTLKKWVPLPLRDAHRYRCGCCSLPVESCFYLLCVLQGPSLSQWHAAGEEGDGARLREDHQPGQRVSDHQLLSQR